MSKNFYQLLTEKKVLVADGAWGTEIAKNQQIKFAYPEILNLTHPEIIEKLAASYVEAGADIILTNTFGANILKLKKYGAEDRLNEINKKGVEISLRVAGNKIVLASMGPTGQLLEPYGNIPEKEMINCFEQQAEILIKSGADGIVIETMSDVNEALCALKAVKNITDRTVVVCMTFNKTVNGYRTLMGTRADECAILLKKYGASVVGANCGSGIEDFVSIVKEMNKVNLPVWVKPNAGIPKLVNGKTVYPHTPEHMAGYVPELIKVGASVIGGCCGTTPLHIREIKKAVSIYLKQ
ncbi:MAG TPA: homocysteine S-methyltransferase family protein [bacterium]|nr:homocysteine S-methyltransferase family protein [bacterium]